jgi:hypothetical protein
LEVSDRSKGRKPHGGAILRLSTTEMDAWTGGGMTGLMIVFLLFDGVSKLVLEQHAVEATTKMVIP